MLKLFFKVKKILKEKGFTLVELLAVIVILAIIMLIAIPAVLNSLEGARRRTFMSFADKSVSLSYKQLIEDVDLNGSINTSSCVIYNIKTDLGLSNTGSFEGWVLINSETEDAYITLFNKELALVAYHYSDSTSKMEASIVNKSSVDPEELTSEYLCNHSDCSSCSEGEKIIDNSEFKIKNSALLDVGRNINKKVKILFEGSASAYDVKELKRIVRDFSGNYPEDSIVISSDTSLYKVWAWKDGDTLYYYSDTPYDIYMNPDSSDLFYDYSRLIEIDLSQLNSSLVTNMNYMFCGNRSLETIDLSSLNTSNVTSMEGMFLDCRKLVEINFGNIDLSSLKNISGMFAYAVELTEVDLTSFEKAKLTEVGSLFCGVGYNRIGGASYAMKIKNIKGIEKIDTSNIKDFSSMFFYCEYIEYIDVSNWDTSKATNMGYMFAYCRNLKKLDVSKWNTSKVSSFYDMFMSCGKLETLDVSNWDTRNATSFSDMFNWCWSLKELDVSKWVTSNVTSMRGMFSGCNSIMSLDVSNFDTSKVTNMSSMLSGLEKVDFIDTSHFDTSKVTNMSDMFRECKLIKEFNLANFDTSNVTNMSWMFSGCTSLKNVNLNSFNTSKVTEMREMFNNCYALESLNILNFNTSNLRKIDGMFKGCNSLKELDLSSFDTSKVQQMYYLFKDCSSLTKIYVSDKWKLTSLNTSSGFDVFNNCTSLEGYDSKKIDYKYANYDNGGYLTLKS